MQMCTKARRGHVRGRPLFRHEAVLSLVRDQSPRATSKHYRNGAERSRTKLLGTYPLWYFETLNISTSVRRFQRHLRCFYLLHSRLMRNTTNGGTPLTLESVNHQSEPPIRMYSCLMSPSFVGPSTCHKISNCRASWISSLPS